MKKYPILVITAVVSSAAIAFAADSATIVRKGNALYKQQKYGDALKLYDKALEKQPDSSIIHFNKGASQFKAEDFEAAIGSFEKASATQDRSLEAKANYNLANSKYKLGQSRKESDLASAVGLLGEALERYRRAIELDPKDNDAKLNYELVEKEYKELKQKLEQQSQEQQGQEQKGQEQQGQEQKGQEQQGQEQKGQEQQKIGQEGKEMSPEEAHMLLEGFRQEENALGRIDDQRKGRETEVEKDW